MTAPLDARQLIGRWIPVTKRADRRDIAWCHREAERLRSGGFKARVVEDDKVVLWRRVEHSDIVDRSGEVLPPLDEWLREVREMAKEGPEV